MRHPGTKACAALAVTALFVAGGLSAADEAAELSAARALFEKNLDAIRRKDARAYLECYLQSPSLARTGPEGVALGYDGLARTAGQGWPDAFSGEDLRLVRVQPGVVYGTYRYRVRYGGDERSGLSERLFVKTPSGWRIAVTSAFDGPRGLPPPPQALVGATLLDGTGRPPVPDSVVLVRAGSIECAGTREACPVPEGVAVQELRGAFVIPGLVDAHVHFSQTGWADGRPDSFDVRDRHPYERVMAELRTGPERFLRAYVCSGVTAVFDVGGYPWTLALRERAEGDTRSPHVVAAGPLLSTVDHWVNLPAERQFIFMKDEAAAREGVRYLAAAGADAVKVWLVVDERHPLGPSVPLVRAAGEEARAAGLPLIVHATGLAQAKEAVRAGARVLVHGVSDAPVDEELVALLKENDVVYVPTLVVRDGYVRLAEAMAGGDVPPVDDPGGCVDAMTRAKVERSVPLDPKPVDTERLSLRRQRAGENRRVSAENLLRLARAGVRIALGTDAGNPMTLHGPSVYAEAEAMQAAGLSPAEVLLAATAGGAKALGRERSLGTLEKGKAADLVVLAADPTADVRNLRRVTHVMRGGVLRPVAELRVGGSAATEK